MSGTAGRAGTGDPASPPGLDLERLRTYLTAALPGRVHGDLRGELIGAGRSNLTYEVTDEQGDRWVVRRPPLGHVLATAHDMGRESRVLRALLNTAVPVPTVLAHCPDPDVLGAPFYVMAKVDGVVYRSASQSTSLSGDRAQRIALELVDVLTELHRIDPAAVGLADFGRPDGYLERQLSRWRAQLNASRSRRLAGIDELHSMLSERVPESGPAAILHGDYRLDNVLVGADDRIAAVLDWEMSTLGDPLADVGLFLVYWELPDRLPVAGLIADVVRPEAGFPTAAELADRYAGRLGTELSGLPWYRGFGYFKLAVILEGIHYRFVAGQTVGDGFDNIGDLVPALVELGHQALAEA
ncbi:MAG TPA: phosphotransferase family protein [Actinomycetes bacterium]|nr:phosphotransferase family protein [Actinomycetes bacterium]